MNMHFLSRRYLIFFFICAWNPKKPSLDFIQIQFLLYVFTYIIVSIYIYIYIERERNVIYVRNSGRPFGFVPNVIRFQWNNNKKKSANSTAVHRFRPYPTIRRGLRLLPEKIYCKWYIFSFLYIGSLILDVISTIAVYRHTTLITWITSHIKLNQYCANNNNIIIMYTILWHCYVCTTWCKTVCYC